jgi:hypothetical protein
MASALFWDITQRIVVIPYRRFGTTYRSYLYVSRNPRIGIQAGLLTLEDGTDRLSRKVSNELLLYAV